MQFLKIKRNKEIRLKKSSHRNLNGMFRLHLFFCKQPVYKKLALRWQIAKQILGLNLFSLNNNENYGLKTGGVFYCNKHNAIEFIMLLKGNLPLKIYS